MKTFILLFVALAACWYVDADPVCTATADIGFILDSSGSIMYHYQEEKDFIKNLALAFGIKKGAAHAGVVTFSHKASLSIRLDKYFNAAAFGKAVNRIPLMRSITRIDLALKMARDQLFNPKYGARPKVPKLLILVTDGKHSATTNYRIYRNGKMTYKKITNPSPIPIAKAMRKAGVVLIVIGVGSKNAINRKELLTYSPDVYTASNFKILLSRSFIDKITNKMCSSEFVHKCDSKGKGGCSQLCEKKGKKWKCLCETGYKLDKDGKSCFPIRMKQCQNGKAMVKLGCYLQIIAPLCKMKEVVNLRSMFKGKWKPEAAAKKVAQAIVCECHRLAVKRGHKYFSIRNSGECLTGSPDKSKRLKKTFLNKKLQAKADQCHTTDGKFQACEASNSWCIGGPKHDFVYLVQDKCGVKNGGCSHKCEEVPYGVECLCRYRYKLQADKKTCKRG